MKRILKVSLSVAIALIVGYLIWDSLFGAAMRNRPSKAALSQMHDNIQLGSSQETVTAIVNQFKTNRNTVRTDLFSDTWEIGMPFEFGAGDWILYIQYDPSLNVSAVAMRTSDGIFAKPTNSQEDKGHFSKPTLQK